MNNIKNSTLTQKWLPPINPFTRWIFNTNIPQKCQLKRGFPISVIKNAINLPIKKTKKEKTREYLITLIHSKDVFHLKSPIGERTGYEIGVITSRNRRSASVPGKGLRDEYQAVLCFEDLTDNVILWQSLRKCKND